MWVLRVIYIVELWVEIGIVFSDDQMVFTPIVSQVIERFAEVAYLVGFIVRFVDKSNTEVLVRGRFKLDGKAVGGYSFVFDSSGVPLFLGFDEVSGLNS